jgi:hypothetical protein
MCGRHFAYACYFIIIQSYSSRVMRQCFSDESFAPKTAVDETFGQTKLRDERRSPIYADLTILFPSSSSRAPVVSMLQTAQSSLVIEEPSMLTRAVSAGKSMTDVEASFSQILQAACLYRNRSSPIVRSLLDALNASAELSKDQVPSGSLNRCQMTTAIQAPGSSTKLEP